MISSSSTGRDHLDLWTYLAKTKKKNKDGVVRQKEKRKMKDVKVELHLFV